MNYEINFLILQSKTEELEKIREKVKKTIEERGGKITDQLSYRKRKLAYEIKHEHYGFFTVYRFDIEPTEEGTDPLIKIRKDLNLSKDIARYILVRADQLPKLEREISDKKEVPLGSTIKQSEVEKIVSQESQEKKTAPKEEKTEQKEDSKDSTDLSESEKTSEEKTPETKKETEEESKPKEKEENKEENLEDLDKKLDEILNI